MKRKCDEMNGILATALPVPDYSQPPPPLPINFNQLQQPPPPPPLVNHAGVMNYGMPMPCQGWTPRPNPLQLQSQQVMGQGMRQPYRGGWGPPWRGAPQRGVNQGNNRGFYNNRGRGNRGGGPRFGGGGFQPDYYQQNSWGQPAPFQQTTPPKATPTTTGDSVDTTSTIDTDSNDKKDKKRRSMSQSYPSRPWNQEDAERALLEENNHMKGLRNQSLIIRFPDPELSKDIVKSFHTAIDNVHFQVPSGPRYCFVQLSDKVNPEKTIKELEQIKFGAGRLTVEKKFHKDEEDISPEAIDPYTLYIGNLPTNINVGAVKEKFPTAARIDIGFAQKMKYTRYAFIRYNSVQEAIDAYRTTHNLVLDSRSIIVRFRRQRGHVGLPGEPKPPKLEKEVEKGKTKIKKEKAAKADEEGNEDEDEDEDDEDDEEDDDEDDDDDDDDDDADEDPANDDQDEDDEEEVPEDDDDDDDDDDPDDDDNGEDQSGSLFQQLDSMLGELDGPAFKM